MTIGRIAHFAPDTARPVRSPLRDTDAWTRKIVGHLKDSAVLPGGPADATIPVVVRMCLEWASQRVGEPTSADRTEGLLNAAAGWARQGISIDAILHAVHVGFKFGLEMLFAEKDAADRVDIVSGTASTLELLSLVTATIGKAYVRECKAGAAEDRTAVLTLTSALLGGHATSAMARECGIPIADTYMVLAVAVPAHPDESLPQLDGQVVARRKLRRLQSSLADLFDGQALSLLSVDGGTILIPATRSGAPDLDAVVGELSHAARVPITATVVPAEPHQVAAAAVQAHELLDTVEQLGRGPGVHRFTELALQYQLTRPGIGRDVLGTQLAPLMDYPDLVETLRVHIGNELSRQRTARRLNVHPNTVDYRLRRIAELTGLDPSDARGLWYLHSALIIWTNGGAERPRADTRRMAAR
ncbi:helix-turn-helix domain-containing protein [Nocardia beijingensis]|uniref:PucR family transcriptional regulator n=1 Tax=Nocardia beijingensis TaxID=95162 RepID=UPI002B4AD363|nr:helix-turn-helix domain-containing protein [Nocardia beijingensis]